MTDHDHRTLGGLIRELFEEGRHLFRQEAALAKTELSEKASLMGRNTAFLAAGGLVAFAGVLFLLAGASILLTWGFEHAGLSAAMAAWLGPACVGLVVALIGYGLVHKALATLKNGELKPRETIRSVREDKRWTQQHLQRA